MMRPCRPCSIAFQGKDVPFRPDMPLSNSVNRGQIVGIELHCTNTGVGIQMRRVRCTNNNRRDPFALQHHA